MAFCANCGHKVEEYDKFCPRCGIATRKDYFTDSKSESERKQSYDGEIKKCPNCGGILNSFTPHCPSCGCELRNVSVSNSVKELSYRIQQIEASKPRGKGINSRKVREEIDKEISNLITSFPIPNTKEDILEFMILASSNVEVSNAWIPKVEQAYAKAKSTIGTEPEFYQITTIYRKCKKRIKWKSHEPVRLIIIPFAVMGGIIAFLFLCTGIHRTFFAPKQNEEEEVRLNTIVHEANTALEEHDYKLALRIVESMKYKAYDDDRKRWWNIKKESMIDDIIQEAHKDGVELEDTTETPTTTSAY